jgi:hypothetical protein
MSIRPNGTSAKNWSPGLLRATGPGSRLPFEWIALGFTAKELLGRSTDPAIAGNRRTGKQMMVAGNRHYRLPD